MTFLFRAVLASVLVSALVGMPAVSAQLDPTVEGCTQQCTPKAEDVNGGEVRTGDETVKSVLYFHFQDFVQNAYVNTQSVGVDEEAIQSAPATPTIITSNDVCCHFDSHGFGAYSSAGFVEIVDGEWRTHQEAGVAEDLRIVGDTIPLYFYLSTYPVPARSPDNSPLGPTALGVSPQVAVHAVLTKGRHPGHGDVIAQGDTATSGRINMIHQPNGLADNIYEIRVDMSVVDPLIPSVWNDGDGFAVQITPYQIHDDSTGSRMEFTQADVRAHAGPDTPPHMVVEIEKPLITKSVRGSLFNKALYFRWSVLSPWGSYDVDDRTLSVSLSGPVQPDASKTGLSRPYHVKHNLDHNGHFMPTNVTWKFDYRKAALPDGEYVASLSVLNLQGTYRLEAEVPFQIKDGVPTGVEVVGAPPAEPKSDGGILPGGESPGVSVIVLVAALGGLAMLRRKRPI